MENDKMQADKVKRQPPTSEQIRKQQKADTEKTTTEVKANLPAPTNGGIALAVPDNRTDVQKYLDEIAPASIVGRMIKFNKDGEFATTDDDSVIGGDVDFTALVDQTLIGWIKFNGEGAPPDRHMGLLYEGFVMPARDTLGDLDQAKWEIGLDGKPQDPWSHQVYLVLQRGDSGGLFTFVTSSITGRRAVGTLLRHYDRMQRTHPGQYPVVRLKIGGFQHKDDRVGWVKTPVIAVVGRTPKDSAAKPDTSLTADMNDQIPF
jgi:hypothetical protein